MSSIVPGFEYDIFISYRHNDNRSGWVTEFVNALQEELAATIKEPLTIYFDKNPHDGLLETHNVDKSLEGKLKCLIFIPIISQTYCDTKSFAWQHEFVAYNKLSKEDQFGRDIKLSIGNVASRILPVKIHDLNPADKSTIESELGGPLRSIEFIYKEPGVNRPLKFSDDRNINLNKTDYQNQINKTANAINDLISALQGNEIVSVVPFGDAASQKPKKKVRLSISKMALVNLILLVALAVVSSLYFSQTPSISKTYKATLLPPEKSSFNTNLGGNLALSPDGRMLAFVVLDSLMKPSLWVRPLNSLDARLLANTNGASFPFWSPDNRYIGFFADGKLKKIDVTGGTPLTLCDAGAGRGGTWSKDGIIVFNRSASGGLFQIPASGGNSMVLTQLDTTRQESSHRWPYFLPDGRHVLYTSRAGNVANEDDDAIFVASLDTTVAPKMVMKTSSNMAYVHGYILFARQSTLWAQPFDLKELQTSGEAFPIVENTLFFESATSKASFSVSENGDLVFQKALGKTEVNLVWYDRSGTPISNVDLAGSVSNRFSISPDEDKIAISASNDLWLYDNKLGSSTRFTFDAAIETAPIWSPDGKIIVFASDRNKRFDLFKRATSGNSNEELLFKSDVAKIPTDWSPNGKYIVYHTQPNRDIWILPISNSEPGGEQKPYEFLKTEYNESAATFSPDGRWVAYQSDESGRSEIYIRPFLGTGGKWQVSVGGGTRPRWRGDGKELFFMSIDSRITAAQINSNGSTIQVGELRPLFYQLYIGSTNSDRVLYDITSDGQRFLLELNRNNAISIPVTLVVNWPGELKKDK